MLEQINLICYINTLAFIGTHLYWNLNWKNNTAWHKTGCDNRLTGLSDLESCQMSAHQIRTSAVSLSILFILNCHKINRVHKGISKCIGTIHTEEYPNQTTTKYSSKALCFFTMSWLVRFSLGPIIVYSIRICSPPLIKAGLVIKSSDGSYQ